MNRRHLLLMLAIIVYPSISVAQKECILVPTAPVLGTASSFSATSDALQPEEEVTSIQIRFETGTGIFTSDTDDVWFDIGPRAWKVGDDFGSGTSKTIALTAEDINNAYFNLGPEGKLKVKDIAYVRVEKKGICGLTDAPDILLDLAFPGGATPANLLPQALGDFDKAQTALGVANDVLQFHQKAIQAEQEAIDKLTGTIAALRNSETSVEKQALDVGTGILQKQHDMETGAIQQFENVVETYTDKVCGGIAGIIPVCILWNTVQKTRIVQHITQAWTDATQWIVNEQTQAASLGKQALDLQTSITNTLSEQAGHSATLTQLLADKTAEANVAIASQALDAAKAYDQALNDLAQKALSGIPVPQPGQWDLHAVTVAVNGKVLSTFIVDRRLKRNDSSAISYLKPLSPEDEFIFGLRANIPQEQNEERPNSDEIAAGITTPFFKDNGISGWQPRPLAAASALGILRHKPSPGADGFVSFDLELQQVEARGRSFKVNEIGAPRYLRIEYSNVADTRYLQWSIGTHLLVQGPVLWDTDQYGFYELHPTRRSQVSVASDSDTLSGVPDVVTAVMKAKWWIERLFTPRLR